MDPAPPGPAGQPAGVTSSRPPPPPSPSPGLTSPAVHRHLDYPDVAALALPRPLLVINGSRDALFHPEGVQAAFAKLNACYAKAAAADRGRTRLYDTPHEFNAAMQAEVWEWRGRWL